MVHTHTHLLRRYMQRGHKRTRHSNSFSHSSVPRLSLLFERVVRSSIRADVPVRKILQSAQVVGSGEDVSHS